MAPRLPSAGWFEPAGGSDRSERLGDVPRGLRHAAVGGRVEERALRVPDDQIPREDDAAGRHRARAFEAVGQTEDRRRARPEQPVDRDVMPSEAVGELDDRAQVARETKPAVALGELPSAQCQSRGRLARAAGRDTAVEQPPHQGHLESKSPRRARRMRSGTVGVALGTEGGDGHGLRGGRDLNLRAAAERTAVSTLNRADRQGRIKELTGSAKISSRVPRSADYRVPMRRVVQTIVVSQRPALPGTGLATAPCGATISAVQRKEFLMESSTPAHVLVVAHRTAATHGLADAVRRRAAAGPGALHAARPAHARTACTGSWIPRTPTTAEAREILDRALPMLSAAAGSPVDGLIGDPAPLTAIEDAINRRPLRRDHHLDAAEARLALAAARPAEQGRGGLGTPA